MFTEEGLDNGGEMGGPSFGEILSNALPSTDHSDSQSDRSSNSGEVGEL